MSVMVHDFPDGRLEIRHHGRPLPYVTFDKLQQVPQGTVVAHKNLAAAVVAVRTEQDRRVDADLPTAGSGLPTTLPVQEGRLDAALAYVRVLQSQRESKRTSKAPRRQGQAGYMFKIG